MGFILGVSHVTASKWEGFGLPPLESNACAKPVLVPDNTAHVEMKKHSETGYICDSFNAFCRFARTLIDEPHMRYDMVQAAREHVIENFSLDPAAAAYMDIYGGLDS
ncbi:glycosyltransferase [Candidatus Woesearchaeota archaeon]|nr:glycosyltransferase [Candidatus Woesearchaeota archaeon]